MNGTVIPDGNIENGQPYIRKECAAVCFFYTYHRIDFCGYENENFCVKIIVLQLYYKLFIVGEGRESCIVYVKY